MIMDILALLLTYLQMYDRVIFPLVVALFAWFQLRVDKRSAIVLWSLSLIYVVDAFLGGEVFNSASTFYKFNVVVNCFVILVLYLQKELWKKVVTIGMALCIIAMNLHEHFNYYQTFMYPYIDTIHSWYLEILILIVLIKFKAPTTR